MWFGGQKNKEIRVTLTALAAGTPYHYRLVTYDGAETIQRGKDQEFKTVAPSKPTATTESPPTQYLRTAVERHDQP